MTKTFSILLRILVISIIFIVGYIGFSVIYLIFEPRIYENRKKSVEKMILTNKNVSEVEMLGNPDESTFVLAIKMADGIELKVDGREEYGSFIFSYIFAIGGFRPMQVVYDINDGQINTPASFEVIKNYPEEKNPIYYEVLKNKDTMFLLEHYKEVFLEINSFPLLDDETSQWLNGHKADMPDSAMRLLGCDTGKGSVFVKYLEQQ